MADNTQITEIEKVKLGILTYLSYSKIRAFQHTGVKSTRDISRIIKLAKIHTSQFKLFDDNHNSLLDLTASDKQLENPFRSQDATIIAMSIQKLADEKLVQIEGKHVAILEEGVRYLQRAPQELSHQQDNSGTEKWMECFTNTMQSSAAIGALQIIASAEQEIAAANKRITSANQKIAREQAIIRAAEQRITDAKRTLPQTQSAKRAAGMAAALDALKSISSVDMLEARVEAEAPVLAQSKAGADALPIVRRIMNALKACKAASPEADNTLPTALNELETLISQDSELLTHKRAEKRDMVGPTRGELAIEIEALNNVVLTLGAIHDATSRILTSSPQSRECSKP